jgi:glycopeptide antibiotics resistance protein
MRLGDSCCTLDVHREIEHSARPASDGVEVKATERKIRKAMVVCGLVIPIALLHFFTGSNYRGPYPEFVNGYLLDILVPFAFYFLLCLQEHSILRHWTVKSILVFGAASFVEMAQLLGCPIFGQTFDPLDVVMYGIGVALGALVDTVLLPRVFCFWAAEATTPT